MKKITMVAGPNGAGKTTTVFSLLSQQTELYDEFLNADQIAQGLSPLCPESVNFEAGKLMLKRFHYCLETNKTFAFETTASGLTYTSLLKKAKMKEYKISLLFLWLPQHEQAVQRVALRVKQGGHNIPEDVIIRRYYRGLNNLMKFYLPLSDTALILDNSDSESLSKKVILKKELHGQLLIEDIESWEQLQEAAHAEKSRA